jgi:uncharacterized protein YjiS (DUF1127 family)
MFVTYILSKIRAYKVYRETVQELAQLSDRELADLGIARFDVARVAARRRSRKPQARRLIQVRARPKAGVCL